MNTTFRRFGIVAAACLAVVVTACTASAQTPIDEVALPAELERVLRDYESAWQASDPARLAQLFHAEGFVLSPGRAPVRGRASIETHYARGGGELHLWAIDYEAADTVAYIIGLYRGSGSGPDGKFVLALRRDRVDEPWLIGADMDNGNSR